MKTTRSSGELLNSFSGTSDVQLSGELEVRRGRDRPLLGGVAVHGVDAEAGRLAAGLALRLDVGVDQGADGAAGQGGVMAAGGESCGTRPEHPDQRSSQLDAKTQRLLCSLEQSQTKVTNNTIQQPFIY